MSLYIKSPIKKTYNPTTPTKSPIASKVRSPSSSSKPRKFVKSLLKRFDNSSKEQIVSTHNVSSPTKSLFSPKYVDTTEHVDDENAICSPPASPLKKREQFNKQCAESIQSIKSSVWQSASEDADGFLFMKYAPLLPSNYFVNKKPVLPPQVAHAGKYTLVLDLDETLVHCSVDKVEDCDLIFPVVFNGDTYKVYMKKRPYFKQFLETVKYFLYINSVFL